MRFLAVFLLTLPLAAQPNAKGKGGGNPVGKIEQVKPNFYMIPGAGANSEILVTNEGVLLIDGKLPGEALGEHHLVDVASRDVFLRGAHHRLEALLCEIRRERDGVVPTDTRGGQRPLQLPLPLPFQLPLPLQLQLQFQLWIMLNGLISISSVLSSSSSSRSCPSSGSSSCSSSSTNTYSGCSYSNCSIKYSSWSTTVYFIIRRNIIL